MKDLAPCFPFRLQWSVPDLGDDLAIASRSASILADGQWMQVSDQELFLHIWYERLPPALPARLRHSAQDFLRRQARETYLGTLGNFAPGSDSSTRIWTRVHGLG